MATWISAQQGRLLDSFTGSIGVGSSAIFNVGSADYYASIRLLAGSLVSSYALSVQWGQTSGTWVVGTAQNFSASSAAEGAEAGQSLEFKTWAKLGRFVITNGASDSQLFAYVRAVPIA